MLLTRAGRRREHFPPDFDEAWDRAVNVDVEVEIETDDDDEDVAEAGTAEASDGGENDA